jgi:hypothetical protein
MHSLVSASPVSYQLQEKGNQKMEPMTVYEFSFAIEPLESTEEISRADVDTFRDWLNSKLSDYSGPFRVGSVDVISVDLGRKSTETESEDS